MRQWEEKRKDFRNAKKGNRFDYKNNELTPIERKILNKKKTGFVFEEDTEESSYENAGFDNSYGEAFEIYLDF